MSTPLSNEAILTELAPEAGRLLEEHLGRSKEWFPHEVVPWSRGIDFKPGEVWEPGEYTPSEAVQSALFVNLLTEDNLPYYFRTIESFTAARGQGNAWTDWVGRWTAEEGRHSIAIRDYLTVSRSIDLIALERARMAQVQGGQTPEPASVADGLAYATLQELATRIAHFNTGQQIGDPIGYEVMKRVAADENHHFLFYHGLMAKLLALDPSTAVLAIDRQVTGFEMPGGGVKDFKRHSLRIAKAGIYDPVIHHDKILQPVVIRDWDVEHLEDLTSDAETARIHVLDKIAEIGRAASRFASRAEK